MTTKSRIKALEKVIKPARKSWLEFLNDDTTEIVYDDSTGQFGVEMTQAKYAEYCKSRPGPVIPILERGNDDDKKPNPTT